MTEYISDHLDLLNYAGLQERVSPAEEGFINGLREKYEQYGNAAFISEAQIAWLERIAERD